MKNSVLIVEYEKLMRNIIKDFFADADFDIFEATTGIEAIDYIDCRDFDIILLDIMLPETDGFSILRQIRRTKDTPVIMISARGDEDDQLMGYDLGADDYITKPFSPKVLLAKSQALIRRAKGTVCSKPGITQCAGIVIDNNSHTVKIEGEYIDLTPKEYDLLLCFIENKGRVLSRDTLLSRVWGYDYFGDLRTVDTHIKKLRAKLGTKSIHIKTLIKAGYKFDENPY